MIPGWLQELVPVTVGVVTAFFYMLSVLPEANAFIPEYIATAVVLILFTRIPAIWYHHKYLTPPVKTYKINRSKGVVPSQKELYDLYKHLASFLPRSQLNALTLWVASVIVLVIADQIWMVGTWLSLTALLFTFFIIVCISLALSYFINKTRIRPVIEDVQMHLEETPNVRKWRISFTTKLVVSVCGMVALTFLAYGVLQYSQMRRAIQVQVLGGASGAVERLHADLESAPSSRWSSLLEEAQVGQCVMAVVNSEGKVIFETEPDFFTGKMESWFARVGLEQEEGKLVPTPKGLFRMMPVGNDVTLVLAAHPQTYNPRRLFSIFTVGFIYLVVALVIFCGYIWLLCGDMAGVLRKINRFGKQLAEGDLREVVPAWSDDDLGYVADHLRDTFYGLRRLAREVTHASAIVDEEVDRVVHATQNVHEEVVRQSHSIERTGETVRSSEESTVNVSDAMTHVANSTQEVSSTILEMQASVEEISLNADVLIQSVEQTVSSSNEITASSEEISGSSDQLHQNSQEAVSFLTELDAALDETQQNAQSLSDASTRVTEDAKGGFEAVAKVEEQILRTQNASRESKEALTGLSSAIERIGKIVKVIQDITEQTNLLSLNASIIAAGAGEYGKSFAVVATQIRELSAKTAGNAKEIRSVIRSIRESGDDIAGAIDRTFEVAGKSTVLSRSAGESLRTILESSSTQEEMSKRIASATSELAHGGQSASKTMHRIFNMIQGINKASEEQVRATRLLNRESEKVREVALQLSNATEEQAKGSRVISEAITRITQDTQESSRTLQSQARDSSTITESMSHLSDSAENIEEAFQTLLYLKEQGKINIKPNNSCICPMP